MMRKRAQHEVLHIVLTFLIGREKVIFSIRRRSFHDTKGEDKNEPHACGVTIHSSRMVHSRLALVTPRLLPTRLTGSSNGLLRSPSFLGVSFGSSLRGPKSQKYIPLSRCFCQRPERLTFLFSPDFLPLTALCSSTKL